MEVDKVVMDGLVPEQQTVVAKSGENTMWWFLMIPT